MSTTVRIMNSFDFGNFEVVLGSDEAKTDAEVAALLVRAQSLVTEAIERYRALKNGQKNGQKPNSQQSVISPSPEMVRIAQQWMDHVAKAKTIEALDYSEKNALSEPLGDAAHAQIRQVATELRKKLTAPSALIDVWSAKLDPETVNLATLNGRILAEFKAIPGQHPQQPKVWKMILDFAAQYDLVFEHGSKQFVERQANMSANATF